MIKPRNLNKRKNKTLHHLNQFNDSPSEIAHELNNPISLVSNATGIINQNIETIINLMKLYQKLFKNELEKDPRFVKIKSFEKKNDIKINLQELSKSLTRIDKSINRIREITHNISLMERNEKKEKKIIIDINQSIKNVIMMSNLDYDKQIELRTTFNEIPKIMAYKGRLNQLFTNLIKNAIEAIHQKSKLNNELISIKTHLEKKTIHIEIKDTGVGMTEETKKRLFEKFYSTKKKENNRGLGMIICNKIIQSHKGSLNYHSILNKGTTFTIKFPTLQ